ncbi:MAG: SbcC/MukB-like Walker B domain-containing protein, partial [Bacteroidota bacterium]
LSEKLATLQTKIDAGKNQIAGKKILLQLEQHLAKTERYKIDIQQFTQLLFEQLKGVEQAKEKVAYTREIVVLQRQSQALTTYKSTLKPGEPCPVCGSTEHPALVHWQPPSDGSIQRAKLEVEQAEAALVTAQQTVQRTEQSLAQKKGQLAIVSDQITALSEDLKAKYKREEVEEWPTPEVLTTHLNQQLVEQESLRALINRLSSSEAARTILTEARKKEALLRQQLASDQQRAQLLQKAIAQLEAAHADLKQQLQLLLGGLSVAQAREKMKIAEQKCRQQLAEVQEQMQVARTRLDNNQAQLAAAQQQWEQEHTAVERLRAQIEMQARDLGYSTLADAQRAWLPAERERELRQRFTRFDQQFHSLEEQLKRQNEKIDELRSLVNDLPSAAEIKLQIAETEAALNQHNQAIGGINEQLKTDANNRKKAGQLTDQLPLLQAESKRWARLNELIGQANGDKFSRFAQGLTLARLVQLANHQLRALSGRYRIDREVGKDLSLVIIDTYQADNRRPTMTLSGGESFLISLALALGLSDLAGGNTQIKSLFIDEGFGTLDSNALDIVVSTLENLQASGKTIGLISHVPALRERIHHQIILEPQGDGFSRLRVE